ncbi:HIT family protein [Pseudomonas flexibilis]|uniref:HIT family hydrolase n=1 Tax=Pseudomonas flexibilis TaxID=706570 RepID=A0A0B3C1J9_9PSED|nr:HIT family protein [Pseudomonas flexibilis]KHL67827.1 HIT family hydrolase [Pseudomonas flexibilis]KHO65437.1 HIT family hydrolase [Pseudomonas flexibilis]SCX83517.1 histidine triad (HIT) family protein [Pseudomonas flexibilis]SIR47074.1 histidine triad (HIT) family protein [Pseudomonas flexibilis]
MSLHGDYDAQNIFAKIIRGEAPCYKLYEDEYVLAFLDLFPQSRGHALVIPKQAAARNLLDIDADSLGRLALATQKVARAVAEELEPAGIQIAQFNGAPAGQTVFHIHFHIVPRYEGQGLGVHAAQKGDEADLKVLQERLAKRLAG